MNSLKFFWGIIVILLGLTLIATNMGWISTGVWWSVVMLWPVVLIIVGLKLLLHDNDKMFMVLTLLIVLISVAYIIVSNQNKWQENFVGRSQINFNSNVYSETFTDKFDVNLVRKLHLTASSGAAEVRLGVLPVGTGADVLYQIKTQDMGKIKVNRTVSGDVTNINVNEQNVGFQVGKNVVTPRRKIDILLPAALLVDIDLSSGASKVTIDLSSLKSENVKLSIGASSGEIILSDKVTIQTLKVDAGASNLTFRIPANLGVRATLGEGLNKVTIDSALSMSKLDDTYTTRDFEKAPSQLTLTSSVGVSNIKLLLK